MAQAARFTLWALWGLLAACTWTLGGCTICPLMGENICQELSRIEVGCMPELSGQYLGEALKRSMQQKEPFLYTLTLNAKERGVALGVGKDAMSNRTRVTLTLTYALACKFCKKVIAKGSVSSSHAYSILSGACYSNTAAGDFVRKTNAEQAAQFLVVELARVMEKYKRCCDCQVTCCEKKPTLCTVKKPCS